MDYNAMTHKDLVSLCKQRKLPWSRRDPNGKPNPKTGKPSCNALPKAAIVAALEAYDKATGNAPAAPAPTAAPAAPQTQQPPAPAPSAPPATPPQSPTDPAKPKAPKKAPKEKKAIVHSLFKFFSEWQTEPQTRLITSIASQPNGAAAKEFVAGYFKLKNSPYAAEIEEKLKSPEAEQLFADATSRLGWHSCNTRLEIYFGPPGSGKTTSAIAAHPDAAVVVCDASMSPDELFRGFTFEEGKPVFKGSPLATAMKEGKTVILDEINLLSRECLRALQAVTDGKPKAVVGTEEIAIKDGFRIIGTMNLVVDGTVEGIAGPLVDRAAVIKETKLDADSLADLCETYLS